MSVEPQNWLSNLESWSTIIRNFGLVIAAGVALWFAKQRIVVSDRQAATAQRSLLNERCQKGAEMLGSKELPVRLGGIYALARLAREHPGDYHMQIIKLFCAFVRKPPEGEQGTHKVGEDVQAVMTAIGTRSAPQIAIEKKESFGLHFSGADLRGLNLLEVAHGALEGWDRRSVPNANLEGAFMMGTDLSNAHLTAANLKDVQLFGANLEGAFMMGTKLTGADLKGCKGLTQERMDKAIADLDKPPNLEDVVDAKTGKPLVWRRPLPSG